MATHKSAEKRARQTKRRTAVNGARRSLVRGSIKKVEEAIAAGDKKAAAAALRAAGQSLGRDAAADRIAGEGAGEQFHNRAAAQGHRAYVLTGADQFQHAAKLCTYLSHAPVLK